MPVYRLLYSLLCYLIFPVILLRLFWRSRNDASIRQHWQQRLGFINPNQSPRIWLHAVSVGETIAAKPLIEALLRDYPKHQLLISNTTSTGYQTTLRLFGDRVERCFFPYDINNCVTKFLKRSKPSLLILMETEIWPNLLHQCNQHNIPVIIANARLSERSTRRYTKILPLIKPPLNHIAKIACRNDQDVANFLQIGAIPQQLESVGNIKFDVIPEADKNNTHQLKQQIGSERKVWVAASTHKGEDELILSIYDMLKTQYSDLILILVPRHPERFDDVFNLCSNTSHNIQRRSTYEIFTEDCDIILGDSMGEMPYWYASSDIVFLGGSLVKTGGHNPLEATVYGVPVVSGPFIFNFDDVYEVLCEEALAWVEPSTDAITDKLLELLSMPAHESEQLHRRASNTLEKNKGTTNKLLNICQNLMTLK